MNYTAHATYNINEFLLVKHCYILSLSFVEGIFFYYHRVRNAFILILYFESPASETI